MDVFPIKQKRVHHPRLLWLSCHRTTEVEAFVDFRIFLGFALIETSAVEMISRTVIAKVKRRLAYFQIASR
jgi:hypothetical protein